MGITCIAVAYTIYYCVYIILFNVIMSVIPFHYFFKQFFHNEAYSGKSLNEICNESNLPFFPKAWSSSSPSSPTTGATTTNNVENMKYLVQDVLPRLQQKRFEATRTLFSMNAANNKK